MDKLTAQEMMQLFDEQLKNAQKIQQKIIPKPGSFTSRYYSFFSYLKPFRRVGGDFFDFRIFDDERVSLLLADATGHGIDAAMLTGMVKLIYSYAMRAEATRNSPSKIIEQINQDIETLLDFSFFSCFALLLDPEKQKIYWCNAGHPAGFLISADGTVRQLNAVLPLIGMHTMFATVEYVDLFNDFGPGDKLILYTDGLTDGRNFAGVSYGSGRVKSLMERSRGVNINTLCQLIINDYQTFTQGAESSDDLCLLGLEYD